MLVNKRTLNEIFDPNGRFEAPLFQRPYVWNEDDNWQPLWDSIEKVADRRLSGVQHRPYFLGTIVLNQTHVPTGSIPSRQIIDGQQRLTSLQLLLAATRDLCQEWSLDNFREAFELLTTNRTPLIHDKSFKFKIWPTSVDQAVFAATMTAGSRAAVAAVQAKYPDSLIPKAYEFFATALGDWLVGPADTKFETRLTALYTTVREDLNLVVIDLDQHDDAQVIFETLNALGTPLLPTDLVKNYVFQHVQIENESATELYSQHWQHFDDDQAFWREEVSRGRIRTHQIDVFLHHYLVSMLGEDISSNQLFDRFKTMVRDEEKKSSEQIKRFHEYAEIYRQFFEFPGDSREGIFFDRMATMETGTVFPLLLEVFRRMHSPNDCAARTQILDDLESFLVRRMVCGLTTKGYNRYFADLVGKLRRRDDFAAPTIRQLLLESGSYSSRWPSDAEFRADWMKLRLYKKLTRGRTRLILQALDRAMQSSMTEPYLIPGTLSIEHLLPQAWEKHWPLPTSRPLPFGSEETLDPEAAAGWRNDLVHTIGNLTLVRIELNSVLSNGPWPAKAEDILQHSALNLNRKLQHAKVWDESAIARRSEELFEVARGIWSRPEPHSAPV